MKKEYDFSKGVRGKFHRPNLQLDLPVYLEQDVAAAVRERAAKESVTMESVVNAWLRENIRTAKPARTRKAG